MKNAHVKMLAYSYLNEIEGLVSEDRIEIKSTVSKAMSTETIPAKKNTAKSMSVV